MASINFGSTAGKRPYATLTVTQTSQNVSDNSTVVSYSLVLHRPSAISSSATKSWSCTINGVAHNGSGTIGGSGNKTLLSGTQTISHNADGTKSISFSASVKLDITWSGSSLGTISGSGSMSLSTIPRASSFGTISGNTIGSAMTINISRASSSFTHSLWYSFGNLSWQGIASSVGTSTTWTVPWALANQIPSATSGTGTLILRTYNGSTQIGEDKYISFTVNVPASVVPTVSAPTVSEAISGLSAKFGGYVKGKSQLMVSISAAGSYGSWITQYSTSISGVATYGGQSFTSGVLWNAGTVTITTTVTDSRGRTASASRSISVLDYSAPGISKFSVVRCNSAGTIDENAGAYARITYAFGIASVNSKNTNSFALQYLNDSGAWVNLTTGSGYSKDTYYVTTVTFDVNKERQFRIAVTDYFGTWYAYATMPPTFTLMNFSSDGRGIAVGTTAESGKFKIAIPIHAKETVLFDKNITCSTINNMKIGGTNSENKNMIPTIANDGVMEIGQYLDFHENNSSSDYTVRLNAQNGGLTLTGALSNTANISAGKDILANNGWIYSAGLQCSGNGWINSQQSCNGWIGFYDRYGGTRKGWIGHNNTNMLQIVNESTGEIVFRNGKGKSINYWYDSDNTYGGYFTPWSADNQDAITLGTIKFPWHRLYAYYAPYTVSDRRQKTSFKKFDERYEQMFMNLKPQTYEFIKEKGSIRHSGFIAQDIQETMNICNISDNEFAGLQHEKENDFYGLAYEEFIALNTHMIQRLYNRVNEQQEEIQKLKNEINELKEIIKK